MKTRDVYLVKGQTLNDSDTVTVDITKGLKILYLILKYSATNGATSNTVGRICHMVSKLSVIDGSNVLHSLSMDEEQAKNFYDNKALPYQFLTQAAGATVTEEAVIDFRRYPGDTAFWLDTSNYANPQLQLTHALTISATAGFATGTGKLTVIARVIDSGAPARQGFVMAKEIDSFATAAAGDHSTDLPLDFPLAGVMVLDPADGKTPDQQLSNFKLTADTDAFIPIDMTYADLLARNYDEYGEAQQDVKLIAAAAPVDESDLYASVWAWITQQAVTGGLVVTIAGNTITVTNTGTTVATIRAAGTAPKSSVMYKFGDGIDPANIFSPQGVGKLQLKLTNAATGATAKVVSIQQRT
jgi:hypothetical protein